ncbi:hypothetical protein NXY44_21960 [Phocaeicola vulgatus]|uniref:DUF6956 domain-containing protein n=1 Tax=Phocaeicola vulgatus TaxID=821 RepID=UPI002166202D|nr:hypothetical protein [Phocaeicola vulgatus]MCS2862733.1 hypothetical protein [Phocaeicola vulgatus]
MSNRTEQMADGKGRKGERPMNTAYQTLIVKFSKPITELDGIFDDAEAWGVDTLKGWIEDYESSRFTAIDTHTAVITSEYNMECVKAWLERNTPIAEKTEF